MTLLFSCVTQATALLIADSAKTWAYRPHLFAASTFGETAPSVDEDAMKLLRLLPRCAVGIAGNPTEARVFLNSLRGRLANTDLDKACPAAFNGAFGRRDPDRFILHIALAKAGAIELRRFDSHRPTEIADASQGYGYFLDGPSEIITDQLRVLIGQMLASSANLTPEHLHHSLMAYLQNMALRRQAFSRGVGGMFTGAMLDATGVRWPSDTLIQIGIDLDAAELTQTIDPMGGFDDWAGDIPSAGLGAQRIVRDGVTVAVSNWNAGTLRVLVPPLMTTGEAERWRARWWPRVLRRGLGSDLRYAYVMNENRIVLIDRRERPDEFVMKRVPGTDHSDLRITGTVMNALRSDDEPRELALLTWLQKTDR